jgi:hypothetical protein
MSIVNSIDSDSRIESIVDYINLKVAARPPKYYRLIQCEKAKLSDYTYLTEKIKTLFSIPNYNLVLFVKSNSREEIRIKNEEEWNFYISNNTIIELIDSKNTLKIEYGVLKIDDEDDKVRTFFNKEKINILNNIFNSVLSSEIIINKIKEELLNNIKGDKIDTLINSRHFDVNLKKLFDKTIENTEYINSLKNMELNDDSEIMLTGVTESEDVPCFSQYYKDDEIEVFRSKIMSQTFYDVKNNK